MKIKKMTKKDLIKLAKSQEKLIQLMWRFSGADSLSEPQWMKYKDEFIETIGKYTERRYGYNIIVGCDPLDDDALNALEAGILIYLAAAKISDNTSKRLDPMWLVKYTSGEVTNEEYDYYGGDGYLAQRHPAYGFWDRKQTQAQSQMHLEYGVFANAGHEFDLPDDSGDGMPGENHAPLPDDSGETVPEHHPEMSESM